MSFRARSIVLILVTVACHAQSSQTGTMALEDLPKEVAENLKSEFEPDQLGDCLNSGETSSQRIRATPLKVGRSSQAAFLIDLCVATAHNSPMLLYVRLDGHWRRVFNASGNGLNTLPQRSNGLLDLELWQYGSVADRLRFVYKFDGQHYRSASCRDVISGNPLTGEVYSKPRSVPCTPIHATWPVL
jgi:hypothetical protein